MKEAERAVITFDLFSALVDSRTGASAWFDALGVRRSWSATGHRVYDDWDRRNKAAQRSATEWVPFAELARDALAATYAALELPGDAAQDVVALYAAVGDWPLWPDVAESLPELARHHRIGLLSNVDDAIFESTQAARYVDPDLAMTSQRLGHYKPDPQIYRSADAVLGPIVHVATSARDVRGALEAGIAVVRLRRPGHALDPDGPTPAYEVSSLLDLPEQVARARGGQGGRETQARPSRR